mmetsp:Transcript_12654/g.39943  ORF Transcript_12654/g.39943 Transcript_12654/m.39943 type:complete len:259 (-) Transcript_12654:117-893(-)
MGSLSGSRPSSSALLASWAAARSATAAASSTSSCPRMRSGLLCGGPLPAPPSAASSAVCTALATMPATRSRTISSRSSAAASWGRAPRPPPSSSRRSRESGFLAPSSAPAPAPGSPPAASPTAGALARVSFSLRNCRARARLAAMVLSEASRLGAPGVGGGPVPGDVSCACCCPPPLPLRRDWYQRLRPESPALSSGGTWMPGPLPPGGACCRSAPSSGSTVDVRPIEHTRTTATRAVTPSGRLRMREVMGTCVPLPF